MNIRVAALLFSLILMPSAERCFADDHETLRKALTFHAPFEKDLHATFSLGEKLSYVREGGKFVEAVSNADVQLVEGGGRFGNGLRFTRKSGYRPLYKGQNVLNYNDQNWSAAVSVWLRLDPDRDLEPGYCDPVQIVGEDTKKGFIFLEWSKDETPRFFRYAIRPLYDIWNPNDVPWDTIPADKRPMVQVAKAPFSREQWTHVVFTLENVNDASKPQRGQLFMNGKLIGTIENWELTFGWNPEQVLLVLGAAYVGDLDDLAVFNRALTADEVQKIYQLPNGVQDLYQE